MEEGQGLLIVEDPFEDVFLIAHRGFLGSGGAAFAELLGRAMESFLAEAVEVFGVGETDFIGDFDDSLLGIAEQTDGLFEAAFVEITLERDAQALGE